MTSYVCRQRFFRSTLRSSRPKFRAGISEDRRAEILESIRASARFYVPTVSITDCRDPKDNKYLELALTAGAHAIVTGDADMLAHSPWRRIPILRAFDYVELTQPNGGRYSSDLTMSSHIFLASPNSIIVLSR